MREAKAKRKPAIHADISDWNVTDALSVIDMDRSGYLSFRNSGRSGVEIGAKALLDLVDDLSRRREAMGFLLGHSGEKGVSFVRYVHSDIPYVRSRSGLDYRRKDYIRELEGFRREGFDAQADLHNHPYEDDYRIPIRSRLRRLPVPYLLRHGLFEELEGEGGLSRNDRKSASKDHRKLEEKEVGYVKNFSGVLSLFRVKHVDAAVKVLVLHEGGSWKDPVGIRIAEHCE